MKKEVWHQHDWKLGSMHRTCAEYRNENQTRNARCGAASRPVPRRVGCFMYPQKIEISSCTALQNFEVVCGPKNHICKISGQSVHEWNITSRIKFRILRKSTNKWCFMVECCFLLRHVGSGVYTKQLFVNFSRNISWIELQMQFLF